VESPINAITPRSHRPTYEEEPVADKSNADPV
jgi:hypothetical protein